MDLIDLAVQTACGGIGGCAASAMFHDKSLGLAGNVAMGVTGGLIGGQLFTALLGSGENLTGLIQQISSSGSGGALLMAATGFLWPLTKD